MAGKCPGECRARHKQTVERAHDVVVSKKSREMRRIRGLEAG